MIDEIDVVLAGLKFLAIFTTGIFGAVGLLVDYKKDGKITLWGKRALIGLIISTLVAVSIQSIETYKKMMDDTRKNNERIAQEQKNTRLLHEIRRGLYVLQSAEFGVHIKISTAPPEIAEYIKRIQPYIRENSQYAEKEADDEYLLIEDTYAMPQPKKDPIAEEMLRPEFILRIFKDESRAKCYWKTFPHIKTGCYPDIVMRSDSGVSRSLSIGLRTGRIVVHVRSIHAQVSSAEGGEVASLLDLKGALLFIELRYGDNDERWIQDLLGNTDLALWYGFKVGAFNLPVFRTDQGQPKHILAARFPDEEDQLLNRTLTEKH